MMDYIKREEALAALNKSMNLSELKKRLERIPAANVAPVRHGQWIISRTDRAWNGAEYPTHCECSQCGGEIPYQDLYSFCPICGAWMEES